jgi:hypothetical protein
MTADDLIVVGVWLAEIALLIVLALKPYRFTRNRLSVDAEGLNGQAVSPLYVFLPPLVLGFGPFVAQMAKHDGVNVWLHPALMMPFLAVPLGGLLVFQLILRAAFLRTARKAEKDRARRREAIGLDGPT